MPASVANHRGNSFDKLFAPFLSRSAPDFLKVKSRRFSFSHLQPILPGQALLIFQIKFLCVIDFTCIEFSRQ